MAPESAAGDQAPRLRRVAVLGAAGGLGQGLLEACREQGIAFTAIVRSRPERIAPPPAGSRVAVVTRLDDRAALREAFADADAVITALGVTATSQDGSAMLSTHLPTVEAAMLDAGVDRIVITNTLLSSRPGRAAGVWMRLFSLFPGKVGRGAREQRAVVDALGSGKGSALRWTLVRGGLNARGRDELPVDAADWPGARNSWMPVSYRAMARWMLEEAAAARYVHAAPLVSRSR